MRMSAATNTPAKCSLSSGRTDDDFRKRRLRLGMELRSAVASPEAAPAKSATDDSLDRSSVQTGIVTLPLLTLKRPLEPIARQFVRQSKHSRIQDQHVDRSDAATDV